ncbi:hypothetical protein Vretimale_4151 [Volvox reticuliferus]|uniref:DUF8204 domain-containing protein n=1 Tax=Volvox reticuliferus TaxID=1737510 RepID=A0A8J4BZ05_9CHLO|nr:hypothetical protein Vretifemale_2732 [Volvox reticuliferus]GIL98848.1 hypothetical protein Vretimale_4151 [Volvox reticuliferus]
MPSNSVEEPVTGPPQAKCCLGVTYFNRILERNGKVPKCMGLAQFKQGDQDNDDVRMLNEATGDFQYYCVGYSSHPTDARPASQGQPTQMPFCEGVEIAITEERVPAAPLTDSVAGSLMRDRSTHAVEHVDSDSGHKAPPLPPTTSGPSDEDRNIHARFRKNFLRNADSLLSALTGEKLPPLPVELRKYDTVAEARNSFTEAATVNLQKMRVMAEFITNRTMDAAKPIWERLWSEEEAE